MPAAWVSAGAAVVGVANSMGAFGESGGGGGGGGAGGGMTYGQYDPYGNIGGRTDAANKLQNLVNNPSSAMSQPGYQQQLQQGISAQQAAGAASGTLQSGAQANALQSQGQNTFNAYYQQMLGNLGALSGATSQTPGGAASAYSNASTAGNQLSYNMLQGQSANILGLGGYLSGLVSSNGLFGSGNQSSAANISGYASSGASYQNSFGSDTQFGDGAYYGGPV